MTIILDTIKIYSDSTYICACGSFAHVSIILQLYMAELFWGCGNISYSSNQSNHEWLKTYLKGIILFSIWYVEIQLHRESKFQVLIYICYLTVICFPFKSYQSNQTRSTTLRSFIDCEYSSYLFLLILWHTTHVNIPLICFF
jgi:hypothetical protein